MWKIARRLQRAACARQKNGFFTTVGSTQTPALLYPLYSRVIGECSLPLTFSNNTQITLPLKDSIIPLESLNRGYLLTPKTFSSFDKYINDLATIVDSINITFLKLAGLLTISALMQISHKLFSWLEYYAIAEFTAINLLNYGYTDRAIRLIETMPKVLRHSNHFDIVGVQPMYILTLELLTLAYLIKGNLIKAEECSNIFLNYTQNQPTFVDYHARALIIKSLTHFTKSEYQKSITLQEKAIDQLQKSRCSNLKAIALYNLWIVQRLQKDEEKASKTLSDLTCLLEKLEKPSCRYIKAFIQQQIDSVNCSSSPLKTP